MKKLIILLGLIGCLISCKTTERRWVIYYISQEEDYVAVYDKDSTNWEEGRRYKETYHLGDTIK